VSLCPECNDLGYLLNGHHDGRGNGSGPITLNLTACFYPTCTVEIRDIASFQVLGMFTGVVRSPDGSIMALDGFVKPVFR
jgi:hypothetical protein